MEFFRGSAAPGVDEEFNAIIASKECKEDNRCGTLGQLTTMSFLKPFSCIGIIYLSYTLSGFGAAFAYSNDYFDHAGAHAMSYGTDSVVLGLVTCTLTLLAPFILFKLPKKRLLVTCGFVSSIAFILGDYFVTCGEADRSKDRSCYPTRRRTFGQLEDICLTRGYVLGDTNSVIQC